MVSTLAMLAAVAATPANFDATNFSHKFEKGTKTTYELTLTGAEEGMDMEMKAVFDMTVTNVSSDGGASVLISVSSMNASFGGQEMPMDESEQVEFKIDKNGAPTEVTMEGFTAIYYISMLTQYLPNKSLNEGDSYNADVKMGEVSYKGKGEYGGHSKFEGNEYSVLKSKGTIDVEDDDPAEVMTELFFDKSKGHVMATRSQLSTPDGDFVMVLKVKK